MIKIRNIHKTFGENTILRGIDLDVCKGQVVVILGPSGSGKTTFLRCLNALEMPEDGQIEFESIWMCAKGRWSSSSGLPAQAKRRFCDA